ncbi:MAG: HAD-IA family hydrolase [Abditibacteriota bacterium]|nr:HAD-IA family hydrolase [Abditibacteriota bacterium]
MIKGIIFDMDGVLCDSEPFICKAAILMFAEKGLTVKEEDFIPFVGAGENRYIGGVAEKYGLKVDIEEVKARTYAIYCDIIKGSLKPMNGVYDFVTDCRKKGLKLAVASSADLVKVRANLAEIGLPFESFDTVINGLDIERKKPAPDIFLLAARRLGLRPEDCLVVEDAVNGVEAAKNAGMTALGILSSFTKEELCLADYHARDLSCVPPEALE